MRKLLATIAGVLVAVGCTETTGLVDRPTNLFYQLLPSGDPDLPLGVILTWDPVPDGNLQAYNVYGREEGSAEFDLRATTTSTSYHELGRPDLEYRVTAVNADGDESAPSESVLIDERLRLERPDAIASTSLDGAVLIAWSDNPFTSAPDGFQTYRVYTTGFDLDAGLCDATWTLEGTTVAPEFLSSALANGVPRCFAVSAESIEGFESLWSDNIADTPRPDARNVLLNAIQVDVGSSGFRFHDDLNGDGIATANELGLVRAGNLSSVDFRIDRTVGGDMLVLPVFSGTRVTQFGAGPIADLTSIDVAPVGGYGSAGIPAQPGFGYVFEIDEGGSFPQFGAIRVSHVGTDFVIFDWSYQTDPGNPELLISGGKTVTDEELVVKGRR